MKKEKVRKPYKAWIAIPRGIVKIFVPKQRTVWLDKTPENPCIYVCNHQRTFGPLAMMSRFQRYKECRPWVIGEICKAKEIPAYAKKDFWCKEGKWYTPLYHATITKFAQLVIPPVMQGIGGVPVYHDMRVRTTFAKSVEYLQEGDSLVLFPEKPQEFGKYEEDFMTGFVMTARLFEKKYGRKISMYPVYLSKKKKTICVGKPLHSNSELKAGEDISKVASELSRQMKKMANDLEGEGRVAKE